jgi:hypothetical protein
MTKIIRCEIDEDGLSCPFKIFDINEEIARLIDLLGIETGYFKEEEWLCPHEMTRFIGCLEMMDYSIDYYNYNFNTKRISKNEAIKFLKRCLDEQNGE